MKKTVLGIFLVALLFFVSGNVLAGTKWRCLKTDHFSVFYPSELEKQAREVLGILEYYRPEVEKITGNERLHLPVVLADFGIIANGFADPVFYRSHLFWYPPTGMLDMGGVEDWNTLVAVHEYTHMLQMTNASGFRRVIRDVFGNIYNPNCMVPGWIYEGITVYSESRLSEFQGRLNDGRFNAYVGARAAADRFPTIVDPTMPMMDFHLDEIYTYGGVFFEYLAHEFGEEKLGEFFTEHGSGFGDLNTDAEEVFGKTFDQLWQDWEVYEKERYKDFRIDGSQVTQSGGHKANTLLISGDDGCDRLYYQIIRPVKANAGKVYTYYEIKEKNLGSGEEKTVASAPMLYSTPIKIFKNKLYYGVYEIKAGYANPANLGLGMTNTLFEKDLSTGKERKVFTGEIRSFDLLADGSILYTVVKREEYGSSLYSYKPGEGHELLYDLDVLVDEILVDGEDIYFVASEEKKNNGIFSFCLASGNLLPLVYTPYNECEISVVGDKLFYRANYDQINSIYCYDLTDEQVYKITDGSYAVYPQYSERDNEIYFMSLHPDGYDLYKKEVTYLDYELPQPTFTDWPDFSLEELEVREGGFWDNIKTLTPKMVSPTVHISNKGFGPGIEIYGGDALYYIPQYSASLYYDFIQKKFGTNIVVPVNAMPGGQLAFAYSSQAERPLIMAMGYCLYLNQASSGLSSIVAGGDLQFGKGVGLEITPNLNFSFIYPGLTADLGLALPLESDLLGGSQKRIGFCGDLSMAKNIGDGELLFAVQGVHDPQKVGNALPAIRGYSEFTDAKTGGNFSLEYGRPLIKIRKKGKILNMPMGLEDFCGDLFIDAAFAKGEDFRLSGGLEVYQEFLLGLSSDNLKVSPGLGLGLNLEGDPFIHFVFKGLF